MMTVRTKAILGLAGVFLAGGLLGIVVVGLVVRDRVQSARDLREREGFLHFVERRLDLSEAQRDSLQKELDELYARLAEVRHAAAEQLDAALDTFRLRVEPRLSPHQRELLNRQEEFLRRDLPRRAGRRPGPPPGNRLMPQAPMGTTPRVDRVDSSLHGMRGPEKPQSRPTSPPQLRLPDRSDSTEAHGNVAPPHAIDRLERLVIRLRREIGLTSEQESEIRAICAEGRKRMSEASQSFADRPYLRRSAYRRIINDTRHRGLSILTESQRETIRDAWKERRRGGQTNPGDTVGK